MRVSQHALVALCGLCATAITTGQSTTPDVSRTLSFDVASIKENRSEDTRWYAPKVLPSGRFSVSNNSIRLLIEYAYDIDWLRSRFVLVGGPEKILAARFDIAAVAPAPSVTGQDLRAESKLRLRTLLTDRFGLRTHS